MTKTLTVTTGIIAAATVFLAMYAFAFHAYAGVRGSSERDRGAAGDTSLPAPGGDISNSTSGTADTGGNSGGVVITGDEQVSVFVTNIVPTNSTTIITTPEEQEAPEPRGGRSR